MRKIYLILLAFTVSMTLLAQQGITAADTMGTSLILNMSKVSDSKLSQSSAINVGDALYGLLPGLYVMQGEGGTNLFDNAPSFNIRGRSTGNSTPMILVDGFERDLGTISLAEVASVEVLTNATASAIYGTRGANGVISIKTKRGTEGSTVSLNYSYGMAMPFRKPEFADAATYGNALNEALTNDGSPVRYTNDELGYFASGQYPELYPNVDWQDEMYESHGNVHQFDAQFQGGSKRFKYYSALTYSNNEAMFKPVEYSTAYKSQPNKLHLNVRTNLDVKLSKTTDLSVGLLGRLEEHKRPGIGLNSIFQLIYDTPAAAFPVKTQDGIWGGTNIYTRNVVAEMADNGYSKVIQRSLFADMHLKQDLSMLLSGLYAEIGVCYDNMSNYLDQANKDYRYAMPTGTIDNMSYSYFGADSELKYSSSLNKQNMYSNFSGLFGYDKSFDKSDLKTYLKYEQSSDISSGRNNTFQRQSILGVASYQYDSRYYVDAVVNYMGSSVMPEDDYFATYPALSLGWVASEEDFLSSLPFDVLKLRTSYGLSGSDLMSHDLDKQYYVSGGGYYFVNSDQSFDGNREESLGVEDLKMEQAAKFDVGVDFTMFNSLSFSATYFNENRTNILVSSGNAVSGVIGIGVPLLSAGEISNKGIETSLNWNKSFGDLNVNLGGNFTYAKNKIVDLNEGYKPHDYLYYTGHSFGEYRGLESDGFFNTQADIDAAPNHTFFPVQPGDVRYKDQNGDGDIDEDDILSLGYSTLPEIYYGFDIALKYKNFGLDMVFQGVAHRDIYLNTSNVFMPLRNNSNISTWYLEENTRWTPETMNTANLPRLTAESNDNNFRKSDLWMENGAYFKLRNVNLYYNLPIEGSRISNAQIYLRGSNLFSMDHLNYADPEMYSTNYPSMSIYTIGCNISF